MTSVRVHKVNECLDVSAVQPLLPPTTKGNAWTSNSTGNIISPPIEYYDEDDKTDGLAIHRGGVPNGVIKIDIPAPLREEPRFPKEKWKTFIGLCHIYSLIS
jgi:shingomyelin synthase